MIAQVNPDLYRPGEKLRFSTTPLKRIRYCIGAVTGALPRGNLSRKAESLEVIDYDQPLTESIALYHHVSDAEKQYMFPTDPYLADPPKTNSVHSRASTTTLASVASAKICRNGMFVAWRVVWTRCSVMQYTSCPIAKTMTISRPSPLEGAEGTKTRSCPPSTMSATASSYRLAFTSYYAKLSHSCRYQTLPWTPTTFSHRAPIPPRTYASSISSSR